MPALLTRTRAIACALIATVALLQPASALATAPTASLVGFTEVTNPSSQHAIGSTMWLNALTTSSFSVNVAATDPSDGMSRVSFPGLGTGWTPSGGDDSSDPYSYTYSKSAATEPGVVEAIAFSNSGDWTSVPFEVRFDTQSPIGGSVNLGATTTNASSISVPFTNPVDVESGLSWVQLQRRAGTLVGNSCGSWGAWSNVGPVNPSSPYVDSTIMDGSCYQYLINASDNVGIQIGSGSSGFVKVDRTAPTGTIDATPVGPFSSLVYMTGTRSDSLTHVAAMTMGYDGPGGEDATVCSGTLSPTAPATWTCPFPAGDRTPGVYDIVLNLTDAAGNAAAPITRTVVVEAFPVVVDTSDGVAIAEGGTTTTFDVSLASQPAADVTIDLAADGQVLVDQPTLTFTPADWNVPQQVLVTAVDDAVDETDPHDGVVALASASTDPAFDGLAIPSITFDVADDDVAVAADLLVDSSAGTNVAEGGTATTAVLVLSQQPVAPVTVLPDGGAQLDAAPGVLVFDAANWNVPQVVTIGAIDDADDEPDPHQASVAFSVSTTDPAFGSGVVVGYDIADNDLAPITGSASATIGAIVEGVGPQYQHSSAGTHWFNPAHGGSFSLPATATGAPAVASVEFPALGPGWTPGSSALDTVAPYVAAYAWSAGAASPGGAVVTATGTGGATGTAGFTVAADTTAPSGVTIGAQSTVTRDTSAPVAGSGGTDAQSGIGSWGYERRSAVLAADTCGSWSAWSAVGPGNPAGPVSDAALIDGTCVQYRLNVSDNVGNVASATQDGELKVDRTAPVGSIDALPASVHGTVILRGTAFDATTRVRSVSVLVEDRYAICTNAPVDASGSWACEWAIGAREIGPATIKVTITDAAGQRTSMTQATTIVKPPSPLGPREEDVDRTPPVVGLARMPLVSWTSGVKVKASAFDDRPGTIEVRVEQQVAAVAAPRFTPWSASFEESEIVALEDRGETTCFRGVAVDEAGNKNTSDPRCTTLPLDDADLAASGAWDDVAARTAYEGTVRRSTRRGSALSVRVADATPTLVVTACRGCGSVRVFHGKKVVGTYSLAAKKTLARKLIQLPVIARPASAPLRIVTLTKKPVLIDGLIANR